MATKKQKSLKTAAKKPTAAKTHKKATSRTNCKKGAKVSKYEKTHVILVTVLSITTGILLCIDAAIMAVV